MELAQIGGIVGTGAAAIVAWVRYQRAVKARPIFENGERIAVQRAISLIAKDNADNRARIDQLELESAEGQREHLRLENRVRSLQLQIARLRDEQSSV